MKKIAQYLVKFKYCTELTQFVGTLKLGFSKQKRKFKKKMTTIKISQRNTQKTPAVENPAIVERKHKGKIIAQSS
jgi:hypothetical protein